MQALEQHPLLTVIGVLVVVLGAVAGTYRTWGGPVAWPVATFFGGLIVGWGACMLLGPGPTGGAEPASSAKTATVGEQAGSPRAADSAP